MPDFHFLNVKKGDSLIIRHGSGRVTMIDICAGNIDHFDKLASVNEMKKVRISGNYGMCQSPTNPIEFLKKLGVTEIWRFILTHPDMDHLDGFDKLRDAYLIRHFWDGGLRSEKPGFDGSPYKEEDWDRYVRVRDNLEPGTNVLKPRAGERFAFANQNEEGKWEGGDFLEILSPDNDLVAQANKTEDPNDGSYVILYHSAGGKIIIPGDSHDTTWDFILNNYKEEVKDCAVLLAPHHGRHSERECEFLDIVKPRLTLFGCAPSKDLMYDEFSNRNLPILTNNQAGNITLQFPGDNKIDVYIENESFARDSGNLTNNKNSMGYYFWKRI